MLHNRTIPICSGLLCLAAAAILVTLSCSRPATAQVPADSDDLALAAWDYCSQAIDEQAPSQAPGTGQVPTQPADSAAGKTAPASGAATGAQPAGGATTGPGGIPSAPAEEPPTEAEKAIDEAIKKISKLQSVAADLEQDVEMLNQKFKITGRYLKAPNTRLYVLLMVSGGLPDTTGRFLQVCDGETLWEYELVLDQSFYRKLLIKPILERLNSPDLDPEIRAKATTQMGVAGPETLLVGLRKTLRFDQREEAVVDGKKFWKFHGTWKSRQGLAFNSQPVNPIGPLPPYIPMDATLYLGMADSWPYQLNLLGREASDLLDTRKTGPDGKIVGSKASRQKIPRTRISMTYSNVKLNAVIRQDEFVFQAPANAAVSDDTESLLKTLDRALEASAQKKKTDAARKEGEILPQSIDVPVPGGAEGEPKPGG
jgi:outer membrane lipoprotein-sorting protein